MYAHGSGKVVVHGPARSVMVGALGTALDQNGAELVSRSWPLV